MIKNLFTVFSLFAALDQSLEKISETLRPQEPKSNWGQACNSVIF